jgi:hypothetical protein
MLMPICIGLAAGVVIAAVAFFVTSEFFDARLADFG